jgi:hypothetical protein
MAKQETKRQHFVPKTYLKRFSVERDEQYFISALPVADPTENKIIEISTRNIGLQKDIYTLPGDTEAERQLVEKFYSENYEKHYDKVYEILVDSNKKTVSDEERELIISTVVTMFYRTTKWINPFNDFMRIEMTQMYHMTQQMGKDHFYIENEKISIAGKTVEQVCNELAFENRPSQILTQLQVALRLINLRSVRDGIMVIKLLDSDSEYITSDNPVSSYRLGVKHVPPFDPRNILSLPLDNKHKLTLMPYSDKETKNLIVRNAYSGRMGFPEKITSNYQQWQNSERFILGTNSGLKSYLSTKTETERPLSEDELKKFEPQQKVLSEMIKKMRDKGLI